MFVTSDLRRGDAEAVRLSFPMKTSPEDNPSKDDTKGGSS